MKKENRIKIAMIARTKGLEYDDRIRKECISLSKKADIQIFVNFTDNRKEKGITSYGIPYESFKLSTREKLPSSKFLFIKSMDFFLQVRNKLKDFEIIWAHEEYTYLFPLLGKKRKYIWDQHEIPFRFLKPILRGVFHYIEKKCIYIIHANEFRKEYLIEQGLVKDEKKHKIIRNYPDKNFLEVLSPLESEEFVKFQNWLNNDDYVYLQGISTKRRYPYNTIEAILDSTNNKIVVAGEIDIESKKLLLKKYGKKLQDRVYFRGMINQLDIPFYVEKSNFSIVLYDTITANNRYCEPNRMYQAISLGVPVIVGCNEPMKDLVEKYSFGIALKHDGRDLENLIINISLLLKNINEYKKNIESNKQRILWENQESEILELIK